MEFKLNKDEIVLEDNYPVYPDFVYIVDMKFVKCPIEGRVADWKREFGIKEIRRLDLFGHNGARIGDTVIL